MARKPWRQEHEATGHIAWPVRKQSGVNAGVQLALPIWSRLPIGSVGFSSQPHTAQVCSIDCFLDKYLLCQADKQY